MISTWPRRNLGRSDRRTDDIRGEQELVLFALGKAQARAGKREISIATFDKAARASGRHAP